MTCPSSHVMCSFDHLTCLLSHVTCILSHVTCMFSHVTCFADIQGLWRAVSVDGMGEADISKYLQNGMRVL